MRHHSNRIVLGTSLIYAITAALWILFSDELLHAFVSDASAATNLGIYKGLAFVAVTSVLLYFALGRQMQRQEAETAERERVEQRQKLLTECFLGFGANPNENINRMVALCGDELGATCALYNRLQGGLLCSLGQWNTPADFVAQDKPDGHICYDVIRGRKDEVLVIRDLPHTSYSKSDPNVAHYGLKTYVGKAVQFAGANVGSLCVVFQRDYQPDEEDRRFLSIIAAAIGVEESRLRAKRSLQQSEERLRLAQAAARVGIFDVDLVSDYATWTEEEEAIFGFAPGTYDHTSATFKQLLHPEDRERLQQISSDAIARHTEFSTAYRFYRRSDRALRWVLVRGEAIYDETGRAVRMLGANIDITEQKAAETALRESQALYHSLVEQMPVGVFRKNAEGRFVFVNSHFCRMHGKIPGDYLGRRISEIPVADAGFRTQSENHHAAIMRSGRQIALDEEHRRDDGRTVYFHAIKWPVFDAESKIIGTQGILLDISEKQLAEKAREKLEAQFRQTQKMEAIGQLAGGVAHDFNNLLTVIHGNVALLQFQESLSPEHKACLAEIGKATERAASLTRQLLLFSRKQEMQAKDLDLNEVVSNINKMLQRVLGEHIKIQLKFTTQPLLVHADPGMVDQILLNLAVNSRDAMPKGGQLSIETTFVELDEGATAESPQARPGSFACLSVTDNGSGIPPEILPRIFDPFFTTKDIGKGTGLGLATVFGVVQQHQGWITVQSKVGHGTTFRVFLPLLRLFNTPAAAKAATTPAHGGQEGILLVEDETPVRELVQKLLSRLGYRVFAAKNGTNALEIWSQHRGKIKLVVTDLVMPDGINGKNLAEQLHLEAPQLKIIYMSGYNPETNDGHPPLREGVNFLIKPFEADKLAQTVRAMLDA